MALEQADGHHYEIRSHSFAVHFASHQADVIEVGMATLQEFVLFGADVVHLPSVVKAFLLPAKDVVEALLFIERRIGANQSRNPRVQPRIISRLFLINTV